MKNLLNKRQFYFLGLAGIVIIYCSYSLVFLYGYSDYITVWAKHVVKFGTILLVYAIGTYALKNYVEEWMLKIWHFCYIVIMFLLLFIGFWDLISWIESVQVHNIANSLDEILISPILYIAMGIINSRLAK